MFSPSFRAPLAVLVAYAVAISAAPATSTTPSLTVKTSTSNPNLDGSRNLKVTATIVNTGEGTLKLPNDLRSVLRPFPDDTFTITGLPGDRLSFSGTTADYSDTQAAGLDDPGVSTVLAPGDSIDVTHDHSVAYDLPQAGTGDYSIDPSNLFTHIDSDGTPKDLHATVGGIAEDKLSGDVAVSGHVRDKRIAFVDCSPEYTKEIRRAADAARNILRRALSSLDKMEHNGFQYQAWFGAVDEARKADVREVFEDILNRVKFQKLTYDCSGCGKTDIHADSIPNRLEIIWLCPSFWGPRAQRSVVLVAQGYNMIRGPRPTPVQYFGKDACADLAIRDPAVAITNPDNYLFFVAGELPRRNFPL